MSTRNNKKNSHQFALYVPDLSKLVALAQLKSEFTLNNSDAVNRIVRILRLSAGDELVLFDRECNARVALCEVAKKACVVRLIQKNHNTVYSPHITFFLPLLKRDACQEALYSLVEMGVNAVQLVYTSKSRHSWSDKEQERCERIMIAAAEQSKNFALPDLLPPIPFDDCVDILKNQPAPKIFFDAAGIPLIDQVELIRQQKLQNLFLMIGPEGDLTVQEKEQLLTASVSFCALTPTILRARQAAGFAAGLFRSIV